LSYPVSKNSACALPIQVPTAVVVVIVVVVVVVVVVVT